MFSVLNERSYIPTFSASSRLQRGPQRVNHQHVRLFRAEFRLLPAAPGSLAHKYIKQEHTPTRRHGSRIRSVKFSANISFPTTGEYPSCASPGPDFPFIKVARLRPLNNTSLSRFPKFVGPTNHDSQTCTLACPHTHTCGGASTSHPLLC